MWALLTYLQESWWASAPKLGAANSWKRELGSLLVPLVTILHQGYGAAGYSAEVAIALNSQQPLDSNLGTGKKFLFSAELGGSKKIVQPVIKQQNLTLGAIKREGKCRRLILYHLLRKKSTNSPGIPLKIWWAYSQSKYSEFSCLEAKCAKVSPWSFKSLSSRCQPQKN